MGRKKKTEATIIPLAHLERDARGLLAKSIANLNEQAEQVAKILSGALAKAHPDGKLIRDMMVSQGIILDKTKDAIRALRDLEAATDEEIEAVFDVYEEDPETGVKVLVSKAR